MSLKKSLKKITKAVAAPVVYSTAIATRAVGARSSTLEKALGLSEKDKAFVEAAAPVARVAGAFVLGGVAAGALGGPGASVATSAPAPASAGAKFSLAGLAKKAKGAIDFKTLIPAAIAGLGKRRSAEDLATGPAYIPNDSPLALPPITYGQSPDELADRLAAKSREDEPEAARFDFAAPGASGVPSWAFLAAAGVLTLFIITTRRTA